MAFLYLNRKSRTSASGKLDQNIYSFALELDMSIESELIEDVRITAASAMVTSSSHLVSPAKTLVVWMMVRDSSYRTLNPFPVCATLMSLLKYTKEGRAAKAA